LDLTNCNQVVSINPSAGVQIPTEDVPKQEMPISTYERLPDTVLDFKRKHQIGRFDPTNPEKQDQKVKQMWQDIKDRGKHNSMKASRMTPAMAVSLLMPTGFNV
jgi:hypothetical protein